MLPEDVVNIVLRKLPVELRVALGVAPGKVHASADVMHRVAARAALEVHPRKLHRAKVRFGEDVLEAIVFLVEGGLISPEPDPRFYVGRHFVAGARVQGRWMELVLYLPCRDGVALESGHWIPPEEPDKCVHTCWTALEARWPGDHFYSLMNELSEVSP